MKDILLYNIVELDKKHFDSKYLWTYEYQKELFNKNKKSMITVLSNGNLVGYINYLCVTKDKYEETVLSNKIVDEYSLDDIVKYKKNTKNYVILNSIVIEEAYQDGYTIELLTKRLKRELRKLHNDGYKIAGIATTTVSKDGSKFAEEFGFTLQKKLEDNTKLYVIEGNELKEFLS